MPRDRKKPTPASRPGKTVEANPSRPSRKRDYVDVPTAKDGSCSMAALDALHAAVNGPPKVPETISAAAIAGRSLSVLHAHDQDRDGSVLACLCRAWAMLQTMNARNWGVRRAGAMEAVEEAVEAWEKQNNTTRRRTMITCDGCGLCCSEMCSPPFLADSYDEDVRILAEMPADVREEYELGMAARMCSARDNVPCFWLTPNKRCKHYLHRPVTCRVTVIPGGPACLRWRAENDKH